MEQSSSETTVCIDKIVSAFFFLLSGYHAIGKMHDKPDDEEDLVQDTAEQLQPKSTEAAFSMPELLHNLNLLVDMAEDDIVHNDRRLRHDKDRLINLQYENERLGSAVEQESEQLDRLKTVVDLVVR